MEWIKNVVDFIEDNLRNEITIEELASVSGYSTRHVQRLFRDHTGDSLMEYVRGRRLTAAMSDVIESQKALIDIAFDYHFESQQAFTRAFQSRFMFPPRRFRNNKLSNPPSAKQKISDAYLGMINREELTLEPEIMNREQKYFVGTQMIADLNSFATPTLIPRISALATEFRARSTELEQSSVVASDVRELLIITFRVPLEERTEEDGIVIMAGVEVDSPITPPDKMRLITVQPCEYAKFIYTGAIQEFNLASYYVAGCWFPRSKYWIGNAPLFNYMQIQGINSDINKSTYLLPLRKRHDRFIDKWWEH